MKATHLILSLLSAAGVCAAARADGPGVDAGPPAPRRIDFNADGLIDFGDWLVFYNWYYECTEG